MSFKTRSWYSTSFHAHTAINPSWMKALYISYVYNVQSVPSLRFNRKVVNHNLQLFHDELSHVYTHWHFCDIVTHIGVSQLTIRRWSGLTIHSNEEHVARGDVMKMIQCNTIWGHVNLMSYIASTDRSVNKFWKNRAADSRL